MQTHTYNLFIRQTDTPTLPSICMQNFPAAQQIVAELLQYAACLGEHGGGERLGSGSRLSEDVRSRRPSQEPLSCLGSLPLDNCLPLHMHTHPANPCRGKVIPGEDTHRCT